LKGELDEAVSDGQLPLRTPLPLFLIVRLFAALIWPTVVAGKAMDFGTEMIPGRPVAFNGTVIVLLPAPPLLLMMAFAEFVVPLSIRVTAIGWDFPGGMLNEFGETLKFDPGGVIDEIATLPIRFPPLPEFLMMKA